LPGSRLERPAPTCPHAPGSAPDATHPLRLPPLPHVRLNNQGRSQGQPSRPAIIACRHHITRQCCCHMPAGRPRCCRRLHPCAQASSACSPPASALAAATADVRHSPAIFIFKDPGPGPARSRRPVAGAHRCAAHPHPPSRTPLLERRSEQEPCVPGAARCCSGSSYHSSRCSIMTSMSSSNSSCPGSSQYLWALGCLSLQSLMVASQFFTGCGCQPGPFSRASVLKCCQASRFAGSSRAHSPRSSSQ
jgi:hypothetical protein